MFLLRLASGPREGLPQDGNEGSGIPPGKNEELQASECHMLPSHPTLSLFGPWPPAPKSLSQKLYPVLAKVPFLHWPELWNVSLTRHLQLPTRSSKNRSSGSISLPFLLPPAQLFPGLPQTAPQYGLFKDPPLYPHWHWCRHYFSVSPQLHPSLHLLTAETEVGWYTFRCPCYLLHEQQKDICQGAAKRRKATRGSHGN